MATIDDIEELRAELRHCDLTADERRDAEARLTELLRARAAAVDSSRCVNGTTSQRREH